MIKVRFAPSPTGFLHIGNARIALINYLFARQAGGHFLLRIDDTDLIRSRVEYEQAIFEDMAWLGLDHDSTFKQSTRMERYAAVTQQLIDSGRLYPCYETPEELDFKRRLQLNRGEPPRYDRAALQLTDAQRQKLEAEGHKPYWRFRLLDEHIAWHDLVRGPTEFFASHMSDPVIVRADGYPLYTLSSVVDDVDTDVTHILRGEDHVTNTAVQIQLITAIGGDPAAMHFGHLSLMTDMDGQKLSKRLGDLSLHHLRAEGIQAMAVNSLLARLGTSEPVTVVDDMRTLVDSFSLDIFGRASPKFNMDELRLVNHKLLVARPFAALQDQFKVLGIHGVTEDLWAVVHGNLETLQDLTTWVAVLQDQPLANLPPALLAEKDFLTAAQGLLPAAPWDDQTWSQWTSAVAAQTGRKGKALYMPLRQALTGMDHGPEMRLLLPLMGPAVAAHRLQQALEV